MGMYGILAGEVSAYNLCSPYFSLFPPRTKYALALNTTSIDATRLSVFQPVASSRQDALAAHFPSFGGQTKNKSRH